MSRNTRDEYLEKMRCRYPRHTGKAAKAKLLDQFCQVSGHERQYAGKLLSGRRGQAKAGAAGPNLGGRPKTCGEAVISIVGPSAKLVAEGY